jgi:hypothetical protein
VSEEERGGAGQAGEAPLLWSRGEFLAASAGLFVASAAALFAGPQVVDLARGVFGSPVEHGYVNVYQYDYFFVPNYMTWRVGTKMTVHLQNMSTERWHEWVIGRILNLENTLNGVETADAFKIDFWSGVHVTLSNVYRMDNFVPHNAVVTYVGPKSLYNISSGGDFSPTLAPGGHVDLTFVVPNKPGIWYYGCFVQNNNHWRLGMRGTLNILPA